MMFHIFKILLLTVVLGKPSTNSEGNSHLNESIINLFHVGPQSGFEMFNSTLSMQRMSINNDNDNDHNNHNHHHYDNKQLDESFIDKLSNEEQAFKVQRSPDGKLNLVFNDFLFLQKTADSQNAQRVKNKDFVFPDQQHLFASIEPKCEESMSEGKPFCTKVRNYPAASQLESILKREFSKFDVFFGEDLTLPPNITNRMASEPDEEYLCQSVEKVIYPEAALTKDSNWLLILNNHENFKQGIRIEECSNEGAQCNLMDSLPNHYRATCRQNYIYRSLVAITANGTITKDHFKMPSCCKCVLKQITRTGWQATLSKGCSSLQTYISVTTCKILLGTFQTMTDEL